MFFITTNYDPATNAWHGQNFLTVAGDNVKIDNIDFMGHNNSANYGYCNKAIEVLGQNFSLTNSAIRPQAHLAAAGDGNWSGSILFSTTDAGTAVLDNVNINGWISASMDVVTDGSITLKNTTIDFADNAYAYEGSTYGVISNNDVFAAESLTVLVDSNVNLADNVFANVPDGSTVKLTEDYVIECDGIGAHGLQIAPANKNITFDLGGYAIKAGEGFNPDTSSNNNWRANLVTVINADGFNITNGEVSANGKEAVRNVLNVQDSKGVAIGNVKLNHDGAKAGAPLIVNASEVAVTGAMDIVTGEGSWYGINVDNKQSTASLVFEKNSNLTFVNNSSNHELALISPTIKADETAPEIVNNSDHFELDVTDNGIANIHKHETVKTEPKAATCSENGNSAYWYCAGCGKYFSDENCTIEIALADTVIKATEVHAYKDGKCTTCGAADPSAKPTDIPQMGDANENTLWGLLLLLSGLAAATILYRKKTAGEP